MAGVLTVKVFYPLPPCDLVLFIGADLFPLANNCKLIVI